MVKTKEIHGKTYILDSKFTQKILADKRAKNLRKEGYSVNIKTKKLRKGRIGYDIYRYPIMIYLRYLK